MRQSRARMEEKAIWALEDVNIRSVFWDASSLGFLSWYTLYTKVFPVQPEVRFARYASASTSTSTLASPSATTQASTAALTDHGLQDR